MEYKVMNIYLIEILVTYIYLARHLSDYVCCRGNSADNFHDLLNQGRAGDVYTCISIEI